MTPKPRILFVDDEQQVLDGLAASLWRLRGLWHMTFVCGGPAALAALEAGTFDAVVTDMRMPVVDGEAVLRATLAGAPGTLRLILSGQTDRQAATRTTSVAHQFLSKPCSVDELRDCLQQLLGVSASMAAPLRALVCAVGHLPISQRALDRLAALFATDAVDDGALVRCVEEDLGLTAKIMHVAAAGFFVPRRPIASVAGAIAALGAEAVRSFVAGIEVAAESDETRWVCEHALATSKLLSRICNHEHAVLCGVLHSLGKLAMLRSFGDGYAELLLQVRDDGTSLHARELERFGISHDAVGAELVELWGLSPEIARALRCHYAPAAGDELAIALHAACVLSSGAIPLDGQVAGDGRLPAWRALAEATREP